MPCPLLDHNEPRCNQFLRIDQLDYVLNVCGDHFEHCPIYQEIAARERDAKLAQRPLRRCA
jgi:hypothetical protein